MLDVVSFDNHRISNDDVLFTIGLDVAQVPQEGLEQDEQL